MRLMIGVLAVLAVFGPAVMHPVAVAQPATQYTVTYNLLDREYEGATFEEGPYTDLAQAEAAAQAALSRGWVRIPDPTGTPKYRVPVEASFKEAGIR